jgi:hypothetical protein
MDSADSTESLWSKATNVGLAAGNLLIGNPIGAFPSVVASNSTLSNAAATSGFTGVIQAIPDAVTGAAEAVSDALPSTSTFFAGGAMIIGILVLVFLVLGKAEQF